MQQLEFFDIPSPCIGVCEANNRGYCKGCFRSRDERLYWLKFSETEKRQVVRLCQQRKARILKAKEAALHAAKSEPDEPEQSSMF
ncbi:DUF1289 domain-containing protein [Pseudomonas sp. C27(2019)]|uniref:DUF1289 domain-containing protein n=1 Tax=Pseudomonas sp. C27(2019) TaxID=2604941 RepID=UPI0012458A61|nr:DUF1289 domain-containing protein [Pseudomonas sp. C27(2019)]QEY58764.1 DUF1289 domain-containing protein [Pseudomonas sp. C27(2019)]